MSDNRDSKLQQLATSVAVIVAATPAIIQGDGTGLLAGLGGVLAASVIENIRSRFTALDDGIREAMADTRLQQRFDETVKQDEFIALYLRARDTARKSEKTEKIRYIRNFLVNSMLLPTSREPDKERYLRLIDELTFREHEDLVGFLRMVVPSSGSPTLEEWLRKPAVAGGMISTFAQTLVAEPDASNRAAVNEMTDELVVSFRHLHSAGVLSGIAARGGDMFQFQSNGFTPKFLRFVLDPF